MLQGGHKLKGMSKCFIIVDISVMCMCLVLRGLDYVRLPFLCGVSVM